MEEKLKEYVNADLAYLSFEQFCEKFDTPTPQGSSFLENLELALLYLGADKSGHALRYNETKENIFHLNTFDGAWLLDAGVVGGDRENLKFFVPMTDCQATLDMFKPFNLKLFRWGNEAGMTMLQKWRVLDPKETRHLKFMGDILEKRLAILSKDEKWYTVGEHRYSKPVKKDDALINVPIPISYNPNYFFKDDDVKTYMDSPEFVEEIRIFNMSLNLRLTAYYEWFVYIREDDKSLGIKIPIAPESSKEVFALRDISEGDKRKRAICNFVREHYRTVKREYDEEERQVLVKQHLRGETKFNWRGLQVNIIPADYDLNRIKTGKKFVNI